MATRRQFVKIDGVWQNFPAPYSPGGRTLSRMMRPRRGRKKGFRKDWRKFWNLDWYERWLKPGHKPVYWEGRERCPGSGQFREYAHDFCLSCRHRVPSKPTEHPNWLPEHTRARKYQSKT